MNKEFNNKSKKTINRFLKFTNDIWISEITGDSFGQKLYKRCKEKFNLEDLFNKAKNKYDIFYKKLNIEKNKKINIILIILLIIFSVIGLANLCFLTFFS